MENKFCMSCGQQLEAGAKFCPHCGATQPTEAPNTQAQGGNDQPVGQQVPPQTPPMQQQTPPVQPNPNMQQGYQQAPQQPGMQYQQYPQQPGVQERVKQDLNRFKNTIPGQAGPQPELGFIDSIKYCLANIFDFMTPESRKAVYWWFTLGIILIYIVGAVVLFIPIIGPIAYSVATTALTIAAYAAGARRIRYVGKSPWWILMPIYNLYLLVIDKPQPYMGQPMYQQNQMQQPYQQVPQQQYQQQNMNQAPNQMPQQPLQQQAPQQPVQPSQNNDQNTPQN